MGRSRNSKNATTGLGQVRKETREERRQRILADAKAREQCLQILPKVVGIMLILTLLFYMWLRTIPTSTIKGPQVILKDNDTNDISNYNKNVAASDLRGNIEGDRGQNKEAIEL